MEDSFKVRVDRAFGCLQAAASIQTNSSSLSSLWSLTDEEIERNKWIQDKIDPHTDNDEFNHRLKNPKPYSPFLQHLLAEPSTSDQNLESDIQELDDGDDEDENKQQQLSKPEDHNDEEEEDAAYDKVAAGNQESADRFYMKDVNDYEVDMDSTSELPTSFTQVIRDPRANHTAAKLRLKEDEESAKKLGLQVVSDSSIQESNQIATGSSSSVPDYVRNPSKYTHYTFDSLDDVVDEESNRKAYMELFNSLKSSSAAAMEIEDDPLESIIFTRRKKSGDVSEKKSKVEEGYEDKKVVPISIADNGEVCMMDEDDEPEMASSKSNSLSKSGRRYRTKGGPSVGME